MPGSRKSEPGHIGAAAELLESIGLTELRVDNSAEAKWEHNRRLIARDSWLATSGIPARLASRWLSGDPGDTSRALGALSRSGLVFLSRSVDRVALAGALLDPWDTEEGCSGLWITASDYAGAVLQSKGREAAAADARSTVRAAEIRSLLAIDKLGSENHKLAGILDRLLSARWDAGLRTIAWCACPLGLLPERYPELEIVAKGHRRVIK